MENEEKPTAEELIPEVSSTMEKRKEKIVSWFKNPYNFTFFSILVFAIAIRIYFFNLTKNQPLWTDEADYMSYAKNLAGYSTHYMVNAAHSSIFPNISSFFLRLTSSEATIRFIVEIIPSILLVFLTYKICTLMYKDKKIALISAFLMATFWAILFNTFRFHVGIPSMFFIFLAIYVFWQGNEKKQKIFSKLNPKWAIPLTALFIALAYATRRGYFLIGFVFLFYLLLTKPIKTLIKNKYNWIALGFFTILFLIFEKLVLVANIGTVAGLYSRQSLPINWNAIGIFSSYFNNIFNSQLSILLYLFYIGIALITLNIILHLGMIKKSKNPKLKADIFALISILTILAYFIFYQRDPPVGEPRWYFPLLLGTLICISRGVIFITDFIKKYNKHLAILALVLLIGFGGYYELKHANLIILSKKDSYKGIKETSIFVKENSDPADELFVLPDSQGSYYSERKSWNLMKLSKDIPEIYDLEQNFSADRFTFEIFLETLEKNPKIRYLIITFSEPHHPTWMRSEEYIQTPQGVQASKWKIPFMNTTIDFINNQQDIKELAIYNDIEFKLSTIKEDAFVYEIIHLKNGTSTS